MNRTLDNIRIGRYAFSVIAEDESCVSIVAKIGEKFFRSVSFYKDADVFAVNDGKSMSSSLLKALCESFVSKEDREYCWQNSYRILRCSVDDSWANPFGA